MSSSASTSLSYALPCKPVNELSPPGRDRVPGRNDMFLNKINPSEDKLSDCFLILKRVACRHISESRRDQNNRRDSGEYLNTLNPSNTRRVLNNTVQQLHEAKAA